MLRDWQSRDLVAIALRNPKIMGRVSCDAPWAASGFNGLHVCEDTIGSDLYDHIDGRLCEIRGASTIRVKFQMAATNVLKLIELARLLHVDFRSSFGTVFQGVHRVFILSGDR